MKEVHWILCPWSPQTQPL